MVAPLSSLCLLSWVKIGAIDPARGFCPEASSSSDAAAVPTGMAAVSEVVGCPGPRAVAHLPPAR